MTAYDFRFLEEEMRKQGKNITDLETATGIPDATISRIFKNTVDEPKASQIMAIAAQLGMEFHTVMRRGGLAIPDPKAPNAETLRQAVTLDADPDLAAFVREAEILTPEDRDAVRAYMADLKQRRLRRQQARRPAGRRRRNGPQSAGEE